MAYRLKYPGALDDFGLKEERSAFYAALDQAETPFDEPGIMDLAYAVQELERRLGTSSLAVEYGGTGATDTTSALLALLPAFAAEEIGKVLGVTAVGEVGWILQTATSPGGTGGDFTGTVGSTQIAYGTGSNVLAGSADLTWTAGTSTLAATNINAVTALLLGGLDINTNNTLTNVAYKGQGNVFTGIQTVQAAATQDSISLQGRAGGTASYGIILTPATLSGTRTWTFPDRSDTVVGLAADAMWTGQHDFTRNGATFVVQIKNATSGGSGLYMLVGSTAAEYAWDAYDSAESVHLGYLNSVGTLWAQNIDAQTALKINGVSINTAGTLSNVAYTTQANTFIGAQTVRAAATQDGMQLLGRAGGASSYNLILTPATLSASRTWTFPNQTDTVVGLASDPLWTGQHQFTRNGATFVMQVANSTAGGTGISFEVGSAATDYAWDAYSTGGGLHLGYLNSVGTLWAVNVDAQTALKLNGTSINTAGTLSNVAYQNQANSFVGAQTVRAAATQDGMVLQGRAGGTSSFSVTLTPTTLTASRTWTFPDRADTVAGLGAQTFTGVQTAGTFNATSALQLNGTDINTAGTLTNVAYENQANAFIGTQTVRAAATQDGIALAGRAGGTSSYSLTLTPATLSGSRTWTFPNASDTVAGLAADNAFSGQNSFSRNGATFVVQISNSTSGGTGLYYTVGSTAADYAWDAYTNDEITRLGYLNSAGTLWAINVDCSTALKIGGTSINTAGTLSNVAYKSAANTFTAIQTIGVTATYGQLKVQSQAANGVAAVQYQDTGDTDATSWVVGKNVNATSADEFIWWYNSANRLKLNTAGSVMLFGSDTITNNPAQGGATTGWKLTYYDTAYAIGIANYTLYTKCANWFALGTANPANGANSSTPDANAKFAVDVTTGNTYLDGTVKLYNNVTTEGMGVAPVHASVSRTAQTSGITWTSLNNAATAGVYRISVYYRCRVVVGGVGTVHVDIRWDNAGKSYTGATLTLSNTANFIQYTLTVYHDASTSSSIQYQVVHTANGSTDQADEFITVERIA